MPRVGCFPTSLVALVPAALARLRAVQGDIRVLLSEVTPRALEPLLLSGHFNVALSYQNAASPRREIAGVERIDLLRETFLVGLRQPIGSPRTPLDSRWPTSPMKTGSCHRQEGFLADACREAGFEPHVIALSQEPVGTRGLIARGLGVGWLPTLVAGDDHGIVVRAIDGPSRHRDVYALLPPGERHPQARHVLAALQDAARDFDPHPR